MMNTQKTLCFLLATLMICTVLVTGVAAAPFSDIADSKWDWARTEINEMTDSGIIAGFPDGTFQPASGVTKLQAMLLISRIMGFYAPENQDVVAMAAKEYESVLSKYTVSNKDEIALLLHYGLFTAEELPSYIGDGNASAVLKRYEAAIMLTKAAGAEEKVKNDVMTVLPFDDTTKIPSSARKYVAFVKEAGYMLGISETEFGADMDVNRAQMAVMLYRIMNDLKITYETGSVETISGSTVTVNDKTYTIPADAKIYVDGQVGGMSGLKANCNISLQLFDGVVTHVYATSPSTDGEVSGFVKSIETLTQYRVTITPLNGSEAVKIIVPLNCEVYYDGEAVSRNNIKVGDNITALTLGEEAKTVTIKKRASGLTGATLQKIEYDPAPTIFITSPTGAEQSFLLSNDITIKRNGKSVNARDLMSGDTVSLTLTNELVTAITATSKSQSFSGSIQEIHITAGQSSIVIKDTKTADLRTCIIDGTSKLKVDSNDSASIYDLRIGSVVNVTTDSNMVVSMETSSVKPTNNVVGIVDTINPQYEFLFLTVTNNDGSTNRVQVFTKRNGTTKILDSKNNNVSRQFKNIVQGESLLVTGTEQADGSIEASAIIIMVD